MYHHLRGRVSQLAATEVVLEVGGVGYLLHVPLSTTDRLRGQDEVLLFTHLLVREDDLRLYGFATRSERDVFRLVLGVAGVGPSIALAALSTLRVDDLVRALRSGDAATVQRVKGVGKKLAERLVLELRERARLLRVEGDLGEGAADEPAVSAASAEERVVAEASAVLVELGFQRKDAEKRVRAAVEAARDASGDPAGWVVEEIVRDALR